MCTEADLFTQGYFLISLKNKVPILECIKEWNINLTMEQVMCTLVILALRRWRQEAQEFKASFEHSDYKANLDYTTPCPKIP